NIYSNIPAAQPDQDIKSSPKRSMNARAILPHAAAQQQQQNQQQNSGANGSFTGNNGSASNTPFVPSQQLQKQKVPSNNAAMYSARGANMNNAMNMAGISGNLAAQQMFYGASSAAFPGIQANSMAGGGAANMNTMNPMMFATPTIGNG